MFHWVKWFVSAGDGALDTVEFLVDNRPLEAREELLRAVAWPEKDGFYSIRHFILLKRIENTPTRDGLTAAVPGIPAGKPERTF